MIKKHIKKLHKISPLNWEHPADKLALNNLRKLKGFDEIIKFFVSTTSEKSMYLMHLGSSIKVTKNQFTKIDLILDEIIDTFDWDYKPTVFITQSPYFNAHTFGVKTPYIVLNSSIVKNLHEDELKIIIAHEMGHIMSGHALYKSVLWLLTNISLKLIPLASILIKPIIFALAEWDRKSELTADRASILATQSPYPAYNVLVRMAGGEDFSQVDLNDFFLQAQEYDSKVSILDTFYKLVNQIWLTHPIPVKRLQELKSWESSGVYENIINGNYIKRDSENQSNDDFKEAYESYKSDINNSNDPFSKIASKITNKFENLSDKFKNIVD